MFNGIKSVSIQTHFVNVPYAPFFNFIYNCRIIIVKVGTHQVVIVTVLGANFPIP
ncbi:hypothetical protein D3C81_862930 [compost metagenome]